MIPQGRPAVTEADLAAVRGRDIKTWRTRDAEAFRARVPVLNPGERLRLYDRAQAEAYYAGRPLPALPSEPHPDDLLSDQEAADVLGISRHTVRAYASTGYLPPGQELYGRRWWTRRDVDARHAAGDRRSTPRETAVRDLAAELTHPDSHQPSAADLAARDRISTRTARRRLTAARQLGDDHPDTKA
ncbi:helix-turn-helix domain-containing protein (plasmid) [Streptomyces avidinii]|uniref:helix-turn-helix domain-containing protein n=1 Tax=Streptomyces avidinii TaxID=1895 RepID=UPI002F91498D|nr:helix-turn-helix domain-containing protein [Streptomyces avidinii]